MAHMGLGVFNLGCTPNIYTGYHWNKVGVSPSEADCRRLVNRLSGPQLISTWGGKHSLHLL